MLKDEEVYDLIAERSDESRELILKNFNYIFDIYLSKYSKFLYKYGIETQDQKSECLFAFNEAISVYNLEKNTSFATFLSVILDRRLLKIIRKASSIKNQIHNSAYSLDYVYDEENSTLLDAIEETDSDPIVILENEEFNEYIGNKIKDTLSSLEYEVYNLMLDNFDYNKIASYLEKDKKQIDNAIQRVKLKVKEILEEEKTGVNN